jgi:hypothetical protein
VVKKNNFFETDNVEKWSQEVIMECICLGKNGLVSYAAKLEEEGFKGGTGRDDMLILVVMKLRAL